MWAVRCYAESKMHKRSVFVTMTYNEEHFPYGGSLNYKHVQLFLHRLRKAEGPFRYFVCGEYGEQLGRPHYHALLFGMDFDDKRKCNSVRSVQDVYKSERLERLWGKGFCSIGEVTYASARYCASYCISVVTGDVAADHYSKLNLDTGELFYLTPEFARMSLRPGIGALWLEKYWRDLYMSKANAVIVNGSKKRIPRYFNERMREQMPEVMENFDWEQEKRALLQWEDSTPERLRSREEVAKAKFNFIKESKI